MRIDDVVVKSKLLGVGHMMKMQGGVWGWLLHHGKVSFQGGGPQTTWWKWKKKATFVDDRGCLRKDYMQYSTQGSLGMDVLGTSVWLCMI
jgi:hypothetical protein